MRDIWVLSMLILGLVTPSRGIAESDTALVLGESSYYAKPSEGGVRRWQAAPGAEVSLRKAPSHSAERAVEVQPDAIFTSSGCAAIADEIWCDLRPIQGGPRGYALLAQLVPAVAPDGVIPRGPDTSKARARKRDFDARGEIQCAQEQGQALFDCAIAIARTDGRDATAVVTFPNGFKRQLYFVHGRFISANATMSGSGRDTGWSLSGGLHRIRVDDQRYEVPDALLFSD